jgi:Ca-activated chloride channel homolog
VRLLVALLVAGLAAGCTSAKPERATLTVLASSELADLAPLLEDLRDDTGVELKLDPKGTVQASDELAKGDTGHDLAWLSSNRHLKLKSVDLPLSTSTMVSPLVIGVKAEKAKRLRENGPPSWADIAARAGAGELTFGMSDPRVSGSGLAALIGGWRPRRRAPARR